MVVKLYCLKCCSWSATFEDKASDSLFGFQRRSKRDSKSDYCRLSTTWKGLISHNTDMKWNKYIFLAINACDIRWLCSYVLFPLWLGSDYFQGRSRSLQGSKNKMHSGKNERLWINPRIIKNNISWKRNYHFRCRRFSVRIEKTQLRLTF